MSRAFPYRSPKNIIPYIISGIALLLLYTACSNSSQLVNAPGVRQTIFRKETDLLLTELHFPITNNTNLDDLLREHILDKYRMFREQLDQNSINYLNRGTALIYRITFDALRSPDLKTISFIFYETQEIQNQASPTPERNAGNQGASPNAGENARGRIQENSSSTQTEVFTYSLQYSNFIDFLDVVQDPLAVFEGLVQSCLRQLNEYIGPGNFYSQEIQADREHLSMLSFGKSGIQVSFPPGQIMPSDQGVVNILVPWEEAISERPWQYGISSNFRPFGYRSQRRKLQYQREQIQAAQIQAAQAAQIPTIPATQPENAGSVTRKLP